MARKKSIFTVKESVSKAFEHMNDEFYANALIAMTRALTARPYLRDDTILRRLRELRSEEPEQFGYVCKNHELSIYRKQQLETA